MVKEQLDHKLTVRITKTEMEKLKEICSKEHIRTLSTMIRKFVLEKIEEYENN